MAVSTEDGRILFYSTSPDDLTSPPATEGRETQLPSARLVAYLGGKGEGVSGRIKDFTVLPLADEAGGLIVVGASSDGSVRLWKLSVADLTSHDGNAAKRIAGFIGSYETGNRITCLEAFVMLPRLDGGEAEGEEEAAGEESTTSGSASE
jgi:protein MAK11